MSTLHQSIKRYLSYEKRTRPYLPQSWDYYEEYTEEDDFNELGEVTWCKDKIFPNDIEYVRMDALLERAKEKKKQLLENESANDEPSDVAAGINAGLDMLIGKLNSM